MNRNKGTLAAFLLASLLALYPSPSFSTPNQEIRKGIPLSFPKDHGAHNDYKTEWWYFTGHLNAADGRTFGFELTFFRIGLLHDFPSKSQWRSDNLYMSHFAVTDDAAKRFTFSERLNRGSFETAGASTEDLHVWIGDWKAERKGETIKLYASDTATLELQLSPAKPLVLHGEGGYSQKGPEEREASYYTSFTRLKGSGTLKLDTQHFDIASASVWMDHEFTGTRDAAITPGWDWFGIQLDTGEDLMVYQLKNPDGSPGPYSSGTWIKADGSTQHLNPTDFSITKTSEWKSPRTGKTYPSAWQIQIPTLKLNLEISPTIEDQELITKSSTGVTYWEGRCKVKGTLGSETAIGNAYVELVPRGE